MDPKPTPSAPQQASAAPRPASGPPAQPVPPKIRHNEPRFGQGAPPTPGVPVAANPDHLNDESELPVAGGSVTLNPNKQIRAFEKNTRHEEEWSRTPNTTGSGAIHVKTFSAKLTLDALAYMDQSINEWLDAHPQYEVKFVTSTVGVMTGKLHEPALICQVWV